MVRSDPDRRWANFRYLPPGCRLTAIEPNHYSVEIDPYRLRSPFVPANTQIAGTAIA